MADNVAITAGSGTTIGTEGTTINSVAVQVQQEKVVLGQRDQYVASMSGRDCTGSGDGAAFVDPRILVVSVAVTPTITASSAYSTGQALGSTMAFASASRASGGSLLVAAINVLDKDKQLSQIDVVFFTSAPSAATDHSAYSPSNADAAKIIGIVPVTAYASFGTNAIASVPNVGLECLLTSTSTLNAQLVVRGAPTYTTTSSIVVTLTIIQD